MKRAAIAAIIAVTTIAAPAAAKRDPAQVIMPEDPERRAIHEEWGFAEAMIHGDTVWLSGVVARLNPGETDQPAAFDRAFQDIAGILKRAGSGWDDVIEITTYHTDLPAQIEAFKRLQVFQILPIALQSV